MTTVSIGTVAELQAFATRVNAGETDLDAILTADIDLTGVSWTPIGTSSSNAYAGTFDGNGKVITKTSPLFDYVTGGAIIQNLGINQLSATYSDGEGVLISYVQGTSQVTVSNVYSEGGTITSTGSASFGHTVGFITQVNDNAILSVSNCYSSTSYTSGTNLDLGMVAGIISYTMPSSDVTITNCYYSGSISGTGYYNQAYGGIIGSVRGTTQEINNCAVLSNTLSLSTYYDRGRIAGIDGGTFSGSNNYANSALTGFTPSGTTSNKNGADCYNTDAYADTLRYDKQAFYETTLGWDFADTWYWDTTDSLPKLQVFRQASAPTVKVFNATSNTWVDGTPYVFNGTSWVQASKVYVYNGTTGTWVEKD